MNHTADLLPPASCDLHLRFPRRSTSPLHDSISRCIMGALLAAVGMLLAVPHSPAQLTGEAITLRSFNGVNGAQPAYALTRGSDGNYYGTTYYGGANNAGAFFRVAPDGMLTLLHSFESSVEGADPKCTLLLASDGKFYGTTSTGGPSGNGTVFQVALDGTVTILHAFDSTAGYQPVGGVTQGKDGKLYGTTSAGGDTSNDGTIFQLALDGTFVSLHAFDFHTSGAGPFGPTSPPVQGSDGNFYGVASGGDNAIGAIYRMTPAGTVTTIHSFDKTDGEMPVGPLVKDGSGVFYGITANGGGATGDDQGTIFKVTITGQLTTLHIFTAGNGGISPEANVVLAADGNFYGTTSTGGSHYAGTVFQCTPAGVVTDLYNFSENNSANGFSPYGGLVQASDGSFYGLASEGGTSSDGTAYHLIVYPHPPFFNGETDLSDGVEYLQFASGKPFGYFTYLSDPHFIYHYDLGFEYVFDAGDGSGGVYLYDFTSSDYFYTSPTFPFPYLYDFDLGTVLYYYPDPSHPGHYNTNGIRYFYDFGTGKVITK